ncbi:MAG: FAD-dependent oxidoreductase, partial [Gammaproteobacteria bacterium]
MSAIVEVTLPDIGDFEQVDIIEILVSPGDRVEAEDSILTLESDKATMDIPSPHSGMVKELLVKAGDKISMGELILKLELDAGAKADEKPIPSKAPVFDAVKGAADKQADLLVLGAGPGGYTAAFRAADLGKRVILIERYESLGGVCLNVGCIPSKALLHAADVINEAAEIAEMGISFTKPKVDLEKLRASKDKTVQRLTGGLKQLAKQRKVEVVHGIARFESPKRVSVNTGEGSLSIDFTDAIIACGSSPVQIPGFP